MGGIYWRHGHIKAMEFLAGYLIEESLSIDNLFVFLMMFSYFRVPPVQQHRVLFRGIIGALVMRLIFIIVGVMLVERFHYILYIFGIFLVFTAVKMALTPHGEIHPEKNPLLRLMRRFFPITPDYVEGRFVVRQNGRRFITPLLVVLVLVEATDVVFATDSIPAILAVSKDPFIIFTSNVFAILGLRSLYFALA